MLYIEHYAGSFKTNEVKREIQIRPLTQQGSNKRRYICVFNSDIGRALLILHILYDMLSL